MTVTKLGLSSRASQGNRGMVVVTIIDGSSERGRKRIVNGSGGD